MSKLPYLDISVETRGQWAVGITSGSQTNEKMREVGTSSSACSDMGTQGGLTWAARKQLDHRGGSRAFSSVPRSRAVTAVPYTTSSRFSVQFGPLLCSLPAAVAKATCTAEVEVIEAAVKQMAAAARWWSLPTYYRKQEVWSPRIGRA